MRTRFIILALLVWMLFFAAAKVAFALVCGEAAVGEMAVALWHGMTIDLSTACYLTAVPLLVVWVSLSLRRFPLRAVLMPWHVLCAIAAAAAVVVDASLYPFWQVKLDATILNYIDSPTEALASVSVWFVVARVVLFVALAAAIIYAMWRITPHRVTKASAWWHLCMPVWCALFFVAMRGGVSESTMNVGVAYHSERLFMNHVAVNPLFSFIASTSKSERYGEEFQLLLSEECEALFAEMYPAPAAPRAPLMTKSARPNVMVILWESGCGAFFAPMGGRKGVMTHLEQAAAEGVYFSRMYSSSWRTDRGMVSALSGWFAYPNLTVMRLPAICEKLPCMGRSFAAEGYDTFFLYGGDINFTHTAGYLIAGGYYNLISDKDFSAAQRSTEAWGVTDSITFDRLFDEVVRRSRSGQPWHGGMLTLSSHSPFEVPYHSEHEDPIVNAMAYTDHCLGRFINRLKGERDVWDNLLLVILPDHGICTEGMQDTDDLFLHAPMVWTGGAVRGHREVDVIMSQSDVAATLLGEVGIDHSDFAYSHDVLADDYRAPMAYSNTCELVFLRDTTGLTVLNLATMQPTEAPQTAADSARQRRMEAVLQTSYRALDTKGRE